MPKIIVQLKKSIFKHNLYFCRIGSSVITHYVVMELPQVQYWATIKGGHPQFKSAPPQLRNIADNQIGCGVAD